MASVPMVELINRTGLHCRAAAAAAAAAITTTSSSSSSDGGGSIGRRGGGRAASAGERSGGRIDQLFRIHLSAREHRLHLPQLPVCVRERVCGCLCV